MTRRDEPGSPAEAAAAAEVAAAAPRPSAVLAALATGSLVASVALTVVVPLLPTLPSIFSTSPDNATWVLTATLLAASVSTPIGARLGDMYGLRRTLVLVLAVAAVGSVLSAISTSLALMITGRVLQGCGVSAIPLGIGVIRTVFPPRLLPTGVAVISSTLGVGGALALPIACLVIQAAEWRTLFWGSAVLALLSGAAIALCVPRDRTTAGGRFDLLGAILFGVVLVSVILPLSKVATWGWLDARTLGLFTAAVVVGLVWVRWERRVTAPLVNLRVTAQRPVLITNLAAVPFGFALYANAILFSLALQAPISDDVGVGATLLVTGLTLAPGGLAMFLTAPLAALLIQRAGARTALVLGAAMVAATHAFSPFLLGAPWSMAVAGCVTGVAGGLAYAAMPTVITRSVARTEVAAANGLNSVTRTLGTSLCSAVLGAIITAGGTGSSSLRGVLTAGFLVAAACAVLAGVLSWFLPPLEALDEPGPVAARG